MGVGSGGRVAVPPPPPPPPPPPHNSAIFVVVYFFANFRVFFVALPLEIFLPTPLGLGGTDPLFKLAKTQNNTLFQCLQIIGAKYVPKMSYFALKSSKVVRFWGLRLQTLGSPAAGSLAPDPQSPIASCGRRLPPDPLLISGYAPEIGL